MGALAAVNVTLDLMRLEHEAIIPLGWYAVAAIAAAIMLLVWDRAARLPLLGLYVSGLTAIAMQWDYLARIAADAVFAGGIRSGRLRHCHGPCRLAVAKGTLDMPMAVDSGRSRALARPVVHATTGVCGLQLPGRWASGLPWISALMGWQKASPCLV